MYNEAMQDAARRQKIHAKHEDVLRRAIANNHSKQKLELAAEKMRESKLSLFKGQRQIVSYVKNPNVSEQNHILRLSEREQDWCSKTIVEIVDEYR